MSIVAMLVIGLLVGIIEVGEALQVNTTLSKAARNGTEKAYLSECMQSATWLVRALDQRARTILKVAGEIVRQQDGFFTTSDGIKIHYLTLGDTGTWVVLVHGYSDTAQRMSSRFTTKRSARAPTL